MIRDGTIIWKYKRRKNITTVREFLIDILSNKTRKRERRIVMTEDKKIEQLIAMGVKSIVISKEKYEKLKQETKNLIKLNDVKVNFIEEEK